MIYRLRKAWLKWCIQRTGWLDRELDEMYRLEKRRNAEAISRYNQMLEDLQLEESRVRSLNGETK